MIVVLGTLQKLTVIPIDLSQLWDYLSFGSVNLSKPEPHHEIVRY